MQHPRTGAHRHTQQSFNSRPPCGVRHAIHPHYYKSRIVSIHAPHVGCDWTGRMVVNGLRSFNSRTPVGCDVRFVTLIMIVMGFNSRTPVGCDPIVLPPPPAKQEFQFTHPMWGATLSVCNLKSSSPSFNSRPPCGVRHTRSCPSLLPRRFNSRTPCGVRPSRGVALRSLITVSIHAPHVGCDYVPYRLLIPNYEFQFTHPMWGATFSALGYQEIEARVSIHAPHMGCDCE